MNKVDLSNGRQRFSSLAVGVVLRLASVIEDHRFALGRRVLGPLGKARSIGIAGFHELQQSACHLRGHGAWARAAAGVGEHQICVVEPETNIYAVKGTYTAIE